MLSLVIRRSWKYHRGPSGPCQRAHQRACLVGNVPMTTSELSTGISAGKRILRKLGALQMVCLFQACRCTFRIRFEVQDLSETAIHVLNLVANFSLCLQYFRVLLRLEIDSMNLRTLVRAPQVLKFLGVVVLQYIASVSNCLRCGFGGFVTASLSPCHYGLLNMNLEILLA